MHPVALGMILLSAAAHAYWNYEAKRAPDPAVATWWIVTLAAVLWAPAAVVIAWPLRIPPAGWLCIGGTALLYTAYYGFMARSYGRDDLSRAYPIARGVAPAATALWGVLFFHEHPTALGWLGIAIVCAGVLALTFVSPAGRFSAPYLGGVLPAVATGLCTSGYAAVDKRGVMLVNPALYIVLTFGAGAVVYGLLLLQRRKPAQFRETLAEGGSRLWLAAAASVGSYLLVLEVLRTEPVSYVVPLRSVSVLLGVFAGHRLLGELGGLARFAAAACIVAGIAAIALGG